MTVSSATPFRERISQYWNSMPDWLTTLLSNPRAMIGLFILFLLVFVAIFAVQLSPYEPDRTVARRDLPPSSEHLLGTTSLGQDVLSQMIFGTRISLTVGFATGTLVVLIAMTIGVTSGLVGGYVDNVVSMIVNVVLVIPQLPLIIVIASWAQNTGPVTIILVLAATGWAYGARVLRAQSLALRNSEHVTSARLIGEPIWRIVFFEMLPSMISLVVAAWIGAVIFAILSQAALEFIGLGDPAVVSWGTILYWAQNNTALISGRWWTFIPPGLAIASVGLALTLINYSIDEITNPRLRKIRIPKNAMKKSKNSDLSVDQSVSESLVSIQGLDVDYWTVSGPVRAADNVSFDIQANEVFGLAGESGCGKSTVAFAISRLHFPPAVISGGRIYVDGQDVLQLPVWQLQNFRWDAVSIVFQSAMNSLNPVISIGEQFVDVIQAHTGMDRKSALKRGRELLEMVDMDPDHIDSYPHQLSGGMRQRVVIAIALALNPRLLIMDEPTTALDVIVERQILQRVKKLQREFGFSILFITHDLSLLIEFSDRIGIMYAGELVEVAPAKSLYENPQHPYTQRLMNAFPSIQDDHTGRYGIEGTPPNLMTPPSGCRFHPRCDVALAGVCDSVEPPVIADDERWARCHLLLEENLPVDTVKEQSHDE